ncbi:MAG: hypothetical protein KC561_16625, partial [Myxococcales bacterium]|nr:hypothetical protein [Myxococcales bacterium]
TGRAYLGLIHPGPGTTRVQLLSPWHALIFFPLAGSVFVEAAKGLGVWFFHTRFTRTYWPLWGVSVGIGAGLTETLRLGGAIAWSALATGEASSPVLMLQLVAMTGLHAVLAALTLYWFAQNRFWQGVALSSAIHFTLLASLQYLQFTVGVGWPGLSLCAILGAVALSASLLWFFNRRLGWPI